MTAPYPFSAIVGQEDLRLALLLNAVSPVVGGVLIRGEKGTAKSTAVRGLARLLPEIEVVEGCTFNCDPARTDPSCPAGPHDDPRAARRTVPVVELPVGATNDRVSGSLNLERALADGRRVFEPGLLAAAHRGILYLDEANLLGDHIVDVLLDAAALGVHRVEREGVSVQHASRFILVGTMNPEEGELRPQLLDRFGITVEVRGNSNPSERAEVVRRRLAYEADPDGFAAAWQEADTILGERIGDARETIATVRLPDAVLERIVSVCAAFGVDGLRADLVTAKAAKALAAWEGRDEVTTEDVRRAAMLALPHRRRRGPLDEPGIDPDELDRALNGSGDEPPDPTAPEPPGGGRGGVGGGTDAANGHAAPPDGARGGAPGLDGEGPTASRAPASGARASEETSAPGAERTDLLGDPFVPVLIEAAGAGAGALGRRSRAEGDRGRPVSDRSGDGTDLALWATIRAAAPHQAARCRAGFGLVVRSEDFRRHVREGREGNLVVFVVDASGSMGARRRMTATKGAVLSLLLDSYQRRDRVAMIGFRGEGAQVHLPATSSVEVAVRRLAAMPTGGRTPIAAGLETAAALLAAEAERDPRRRPLLVLMTDGRPTSGLDPLGEALRAARRLAGRRVPAIVVDTEDGPVRLGLARVVAGAMGARYIRLEELAAGSIARVVRAASGRRAA